MDFPARPAHTKEPDPLTDSGIHRLMLGTQVRLHLYGGAVVECGLLEIRDVTNWDDLVGRVLRGMPIEVRGERRAVIGAGATMWAEVTGALPPEIRQGPTTASLGTGWATGKNERPSG